ncbi:hypothetical protein FNH13_17705 [Ornithinimicrobium ciconiae]|uniref:Uncharacterized protein n=1 Tax=Ornithinimicrobium ciconiae TaxID=2594265 RepID=A0A516GEJ4_9MICO|nr:hypothetical protein [Ornithinimicrobium ciconiae]QDO89936.1 hypothetical protein FNH13_17705 [Ornithinimicrobium ciconiae]
MTYALIGATIFHWLIVELPARRRRRSTYEFHRQTFQVLLTPGPGLLDPYQTAAAALGYKLDPWNQGDLQRLASKIEQRMEALINEGGMDPNRTFFGPDRANMFRTVVELAVPRALSDLSSSATYLDEEVAHALSQFPRQDGMSVLQVTTNERGCIAAARDAHIVWTLLEAARRLYDAGLDVGAFDRDFFQARVTRGDGVEIALSDDVLTKRPRQA